LRLADKRSDLVAAHESHLKRLQGIEKFVKDKFDVGAIRRDYLTACEYYRIEAEMWLDEAKQAK
jgi:hypothetical protein